MLTIGAAEPGILLLDLVYSLRSPARSRRHGNKLHLGTDVTARCLTVLTETSSKSEAGLALLSYLGILIIVTNGNLATFEFDQPLGVALALLSTVIWGLSWVINSRVVDANDINPELALFLNFSAALPLLWLGTAVAGELPSVSMGSLIGGLYVGLFEMGIAFVLWMNAMRLTDNPLRISSLIFLAPPLSLVLIGNVLNEVIASSTLFGLVIILIGLAGQQLLDRSK